MELIGNDLVVSGMFKQCDNTLYSLRMTPPSSVYSAEAEA